MQEIVTLINRAQMGDSEAYGAIVSRFQDMAYGYAYTILGDFHLAQDAAQEALIEAYRRLPDLREPFAFPAWLKRIVYKQCDRQTRGKRLAVTPLETAAQMASTMPGPAEVAERREFAQRVQDAIRELPREQRVVTTLFYINGYSHQDIADFLEVPATTVKSRLHASRGRLRERMIDMVEDELKSNSLPADFTQETVEQAVARARGLNESRQFLEAEEILRRMIDHAPQNPELLRALNRALAQGRVYGQGRFDLLSELAEYGKTILQTVDDEYMHHELARTLLAIPAMPEAIDFLQDWIDRKGANVERMGMLAWAKGCVADYEGAETCWQETLSVARGAGPDEITRLIPFIIYTLVDCFAPAGELPRAQRVARQGWDFCHELETGEWLDWYNSDGDWTTIFHLAKLDLRELANARLVRIGADAGPEARAKALFARSSVDDPDEVSAELLDWVRERIAAREWNMLRNRPLTNLSGFEAQGRGMVALRLAGAIWELLNQTGDMEAKEALDYWGVRRLYVWGALQAEDWAAAEENVRLAAEKYGLESAAPSYGYVCAFTGKPIPPDALQALEAVSEDKRHLTSWYAIAREAGAVGDQAKAFDALRKALAYWTNPPYYAADVWEADPYWGELRNHPEFKAAFDERRRRVGPIRGLLHYFPGW